MTNFWNRLLFLLQLPFCTVVVTSSITTRDDNDDGVKTWRNTSSSLGKSGGSHLLFDHTLLDKIATFSRERIPPRVVHAKGHGAFGTFRVTHSSASQFTKADVFNGIGKETPVFVRFSFTGLAEGESDLSSDSRGFALRFYTQDGNLDFPGLQIPIFSLRDPALFPDIIHAVGRNPVNRFKEQKQFSKFLSETPQTTHFLIRFSSSEIQPRSSRAIDGNAVNVYECVNSTGAMVYCKFSWKSEQPMKDYLTAEEIIRISGTRPEYFAMDLFKAIEAGNFPRWTFGLQVMTPEEAKALSFNPFDVTKIWSMDEFPFIPVGEFVLDRNPTNFFSQIEQAAFSPNFVPGIRSSPDRVLQARTFAYKDAQRYRLGSKFDEIEVNRALPGVKIREMDEEDEKLENSGIFDDPSTHYDGRWENDDFSQPIHFLEKEVDAEEKLLIATRIANYLSHTKSEELRNKVLENCFAPLGNEFRDLVAAAIDKALIANEMDELMGKTM